jgi:hypothetical protein
MSYPLTLVVDQPSKRSRLTTFFRFILAIPWLIVLYILLLVLYVVAIIAWFALLFTGRWPQGMYDFSVGVLRFMARTQAYAFLLTDDFPPFGLDDDNYAARLVADPPLDQYSRLKVFFRLIYAIPAYIIAAVLSIAFELVAIASWVVIVITGNQPDGLQNAMRFCLSYIIRAYGLIFLVTETYPPFDDGSVPGVTGPDGPPVADAGSGGDPLSGWRADS